MNTSPNIRATALSHGDEVFYTGLFTKHAPQSRNIPIVRVGNVAAMPEEPITWRRQRGSGSEMVTMDPPYLVETRSIGGLSGSPVFVNLGGMRLQGGNVSIRAGSAPFYLLGLMHGHWDVDPGQMGPDQADSLRQEMVNMGIGVVIPVWSIREVLDQPELASSREALGKSERPGQGPTAG